MLEIKEVNGGKYTTGTVVGQINHECFFQRYLIIQSCSAYPNILSSSNLSVLRYYGNHLLIIKF